MDPVATEGRHWREGRGDSQGSDRRSVDDPSSVSLLLSESENFLELEVFEVLGVRSLPMLEFCR